MPDSPGVRVFESAADALEELARTIAKQLEPEGALVLTGGRSAKQLYGLLVPHLKSRPALVESMHLFLGDERRVSHDSDQSNYRMAKHCLLDALGPALEKDRVFAMPTDGATPDLDAASYEDALLRFQATRVGPELFDVVLLSLGTDGHVASLFPGGSELQARDRLVVSSTAPFAPAERISLTFTALNSGRHLHLIALGSEKVQALRHFFERDMDIPAHGLDPSRLTVWLDRQAAQSVPLRGTASS